MTVGTDSTEAGERGYALALTALLLIPLLAIAAIGLYLTLRAE